MGTTFPVFDFTINNALIVRAGTPKPIVDKLNKEIAAIVNRPEIQARMRALRTDPGDLHAGGIRRARRARTRQVA